MITLYCRARHSAGRTSPGKTAAPASLPVPRVIRENLTGLPEQSVSSPDRFQTKTQAAIHPVKD